MEKLQRPRNVTIDNFRKTFFKSQYGIQIPEYTMEQFLDQFKEQIEETGFLMDGDHTIGLIINQDGTAQNVLKLIGDAEGTLIEWEKLILRDMDDKGHHLMLGDGATFDTDKVIDCLKVIGYEGIRYYVRGNWKTASPVVFVNSHQEGITLAPSLYPDDDPPPKAMTYSKFTDKELESIRERLKLLRENPNLIEIQIQRYGTKDTIMVDTTAITKIGLVGDGSYAFVLLDAEEQQVDEYNFNKLREALPDMEITDARHIYDIDGEAIAKEATEAWRTRDPLMEEPELFSQFIDTLMERAKYGYEVHSSLEFFARMFPHDPPRPQPKHRSIYQPGEWAQPLIDAIRNGVVRVELTRGQSMDDPDNIWGKGLLKLWFEPDKVDLSIPSMTIRSNEYKAAHLKDYVTDVEYGGYSDPWMNWEVAEAVNAYEKDNVRA